MTAEADFLPGDVVSVAVGGGKREGVVIGTTIDGAGRQIVEIQFDRPGEYISAWWPLVTRKRRYAPGWPYGYPHYHGVPRTLERHVHYY